jgi:hypothetical protein
MKCFKGTVLRFLELKGHWPSPMVVLLTLAFDAQESVILGLDNDNVPDKRGTGGSCDCTTLEVLKDDTSAPPPPTNTSLQLRHRKIFVFIEIYSKCFFFTNA